MYITDIGIIEVLYMHTVLNTIVNTKKLYIKNSFTSVRENNAMPATLFPDMFHHDQHVFYLSDILCIILHTTQQISIRSCWWT